ncbi:hypothetical protein, partial [Escherichia coli]
MPPAISSRVLNVFGVDYKSHLPEEYAAYLAANQPVMTCVYGNTATGKTNFKDSLLRCISDDMAENFLVEDEDNGRISEDTRLHLFKSFFDEGRNVVFVEHAHNGTVAKLAMRQPFVLFKGLTFQKLCLPGAFRPGDHHNKMLR